MMANFFLKGAKVYSSDYPDRVEPSTVVSLHEAGGCQLTLVVHEQNATDALAFADAIRAAALKHKPASEPVAAEV